MTNPFTTIYKSDQQKEQPPSQGEVNPFDVIARSGPSPVARPTVAPGPEPDNVLEILGKSFAQGLLGFPRDISRLADLTLPSGIRADVERAGGGLTSVLNRSINALEPEIGPATSSSFEEFARRHPTLNRLVPGKLGIAGIPGDVQALAATIGGTGGELATTYGEYKGIEEGVKATATLGGKVAPKLADRAVNRIAGTSAKIAEKIGGDVGRQVGAAAVQLPKQVAIGLGQQALSDPENFGDAKSIGTGVLFGFLGALSDGVAFNRAWNQYTRGRPYQPPEGGTTASSRAPEPPPPQALPPGLKNDSPANKPIREISDYDIVNSSPSEVADLAKRAKAERTTILRGVLGPTGSRVYTRALRIARSATSSPEAASQALATINNMRAKLSADQTKALDDVDTEGYTSQRMRLIAKTVKDYTPEKLSTLPTEALVQDFGNVLMSTSYGRNISGLYRLNRLYLELASRGAGPQDIIPAITQHMTAEGVDPTEAMKAVVNRMVEIAGNVEALKNPPSQAAAQGKPNARLDTDIADVISSQITGKGQVGAGFDPSLFKKLGQNLYKGDIATVATKEGLQNAIDAIAPKGSGKVDIDFDEANRALTIEDNGVGMTPEIAANQFMDIGGSGKQSTQSAGGYGLAKVGLLANAEHFRMETVAVKGNQRVLTTIEGSADDWAHGRLKFESRPVDAYDKDIPPGQTGTRLFIKFDKDAKLEFESAKEFINKAKRYNQSSGIQISSTIGKSEHYDWDEEFIPSGESDLVQIPEASIEFTPGKERSPYQSWVEMHVLNNGIYQFSENKYNIKGAGLPKEVLVNIKSKVGVDEGNYPFTTSREDLKGPVKDAIEQWINNLAGNAGRQELDNIYKNLLNSPKIPGTHYSVIGPDLSAETSGIIQQRNYTVELVKQLDRMTQVILEDFKNVYPKIKAPRFGGLGVEKGYLGVNILSEKINERAKEVGGKELPYSENLILHNPYTTLTEVLDRFAEKKITNPSLDDVAFELAKQTWGTMVHEVGHQISRGHGEEFSGVMTRMVGEVIQTGGYSIPILTKIYAKALKEGFRDDHTAVSDEWGDSILKKFSGHQVSDVPGNAPLGGGEQGAAGVSSYAASGSGKGRVLSKGAVAGSKPVSRASSTNAGTGSAGTRNTVDPVESGLNDSGPKAYGADVYEQNRDLNALPPYSKNIQSMIVPGPRPEAPRSAWFGGEANLINKITTPFHQAMAAGVDRYHALKEFDKALGIKTPAERSVYVAARLASGTAGKVHQFLVNEPFVLHLDGSVEFTGNKSLAKILAPLKGRLNEFREAVVATKAQEMHNAGQASGFDPQDVTLSLNNTSPDILEAVKDHALMLRDAKRYAEEFGLIDKEMSTLLDFLGSSHVSWERVYDKAIRSKSPQYTALNVGNIFKPEVSKEAFKIVDPIQTSVDYVRRLIRASDLNHIGVLLVEWAEREPQALKGLIEPANRQKNIAVNGLDEGDARAVKKAAKELGVTISDEVSREVAAIMSNSWLKVDGDQMIVRRNGKGELWKVAPEIGQALRGLSPQEIHWFARTLGYFSNAVKVGITLDPTFALTQAFIGSFHSAMQSKNGFRLGVDSFKGFAHKVMNSKDYQRFLAGGGAFGFIGAVETTGQATLRNVLPKTVAGRVKDAAMHPAEALRKLLQPLNEMNQMGEFLRATGRGKSVMEAAFDARNVDTDFGVIGLKMQGLAHATQFLNPYIQGSRTFAQAMTRNPKDWNAWQLLALLGISLPSAYFWFAGEGDDEVRSVQLTPVGQANWIVRIGGDIVKIRKPILWGAIFGNTMEFALSKMKEDQPELYDIYFKGLKDQVLFQGLPALAQLAWGLGANKDYLTGSPIVPEALENVEGKYQETGNESQLARDIGQATNISPAQIEFAIRNLTGTGGSQIARALDVVLPGTEVSRPSPVKADLPILSRFFARYPSSGAEPIRTFYDRAQRLEKIVNTISLMEKKIATEAQGQEYKKYIQEHRDDLGLAPLYAETRQELAAMRQVITETDAMPDKVLSRERKREINNYVLDNMINLARRINTAAALSGRYHRGEAQDVRSDSGLSQQVRLR